MTELRKCGHPLGGERWCPDCELQEMRAPRNRAALVDAESAGEPTAIAWEYENMYGNKFLCHGDPNQWHPHDKAGFKNFRALTYCALASASQAERPVVPDGYVLAPAEPTEAMLSAMAECDGYLPGDRDRPGLVRWEDYWRMAIAAVRRTP